MPYKTGDRVRFPERTTVDLLTVTVTIPAGSVLTVLAARSGGVRVFDGGLFAWIPIKFVTRADG